MAKGRRCSLLFFSSRYPNIQKAAEDLRSVPTARARKKVLLMHENVSIEGAENLPRYVMSELSERFDIVLNGHEHIYRNPYPNVYCLSAVLPWRPGFGNSDIEISWKHDQPEIKRNEGRFGFYILDTTKMDLRFVPVDLGIKILSVKLSLSDAPAVTVRDRLVELSGLLSQFGPPENTIVRVYLEGTLKEGDERIDVGFCELERRYYSNYYEGGSKTILRVESLKGGGAYLSKEELKYISVEEALRQLEGEIPGIREFYEEVYDLIERKTFDTGALIERIKNSKILGEAK
jgi:hypothetical protein